MTSNTRSLDFASDSLREPYAALEMTVEGLMLRVTVSDLDALEMTVG